MDYIDNLKKSNKKFNKNRKIKNTNADLIDFTGDCIESETIKVIVDNRNVKHKTQNRIRGFTLSISIKRFRSGFKKQSLDARKNSFKNSFEKNSAYKPNLMQNCENESNEVFKIKTFNKDSIKKELDEVIIDEKRYKNLKKPTIRGHNGLNNFDVNTKREEVDPSVKYKNNLKLFEAILSQHNIILYNRKVCKYYSLQSLDWSDFCCTRCSQCIFDSNNEQIKYNSNVSSCDSCLNNKCKISELDVYNI